MREDCLGGIMKCYWGVLGGVKNACPVLVDRGSRFVINPQPLVHAGSAIGTFKVVTSRVERSQFLFWSICRSAFATIEGLGLGGENATPAGARLRGER